MSTEARMSRPSKRFVLPYEPEYTAHGGDSPIGRARRPPRARQRTGTVLTPGESQAGPAVDATLRRNKGRAVERERSENLPPHR